MTPPLVEEPPDDIEEAFPSTPPDDAPEGGADLPEMPPEGDGEDGGLPVAEPASGVGGGPAQVLSFPAREPAAVVVADPPRGVLVHGIPEDVPPREGELRVVRTSTAFADTVLALPVPGTLSEFEKLADILRTLKTFEEQVVEETKEDIELAFTLHRRLCARRDENLAPLKRARQHVGYLGGEFRVRQERERKRLEDEARRIEMERRQAEADAAARAALDAGATTQEAEAMRQDVERTPVSLPAAVTTPPPKVKGLATRSKWTYRVVDEAKLPDAYWLRSINHKAIEATVKQQKGETRIPGVVVEEVVTTVGTGR